MPYTYATEDNDNDSDYESDGGTHYRARSVGQYKLEIKPDEGSYKFGVIYLSTFDNTLSYSLREPKTVFRGNLDLNRLSPDVASLQKSMTDRGLIPALQPYTSQLIAIIVQNKHARNGYIGHGTYSFVRLFESEDRAKVKVVLEVANTDNQTKNWKEYASEARVKQCFFNALYPSDKTHLDLRDDSKKYRLVLPKKPGVLYFQLSIHNVKQQIMLCISTINALEACHAAGYVVVDLKDDNILYVSPLQNNDVGTSYLIDGGMSIKTGDVISSAFQNIEASLIAGKRTHYDQIAPECWTGLNLPGCRAHTSMDVYSMGSLLKYTLKRPCSELVPLLNDCIMTDPAQRPTLGSLKIRLEAMLSSLHDDVFELKQVML